MTGPAARQPISTSKAAPEYGERVSFAVAVGDVGLGSQIFGRNFSGSNKHHQQLCITIGT